MIKFRPGEALVHKKGLVNADLLFEENKKSSSCYMTPFGDIMLDVSTTSVDITEADDVITLDVDYDLEANYEPLASCRIRVKVCPRESAPVHLRI